MVACNLRLSYNFPGTTLLVEDSMGVVWMSTSASTMPIGTLPGRVALLRVSAEGADRGRRNAAAVLELDGYRGRVVRQEATQKAE